MSDCTATMESYVKPGHTHVCIHENPHGDDNHICGCGSGFGVAT